MKSIFDKIQEKKRVRALKKLAAQEYLAARGTSHLKILRAADAELRTKYNELDIKKQQAKIELDKLKEKLNKDLQLELENFIVRNYLTQVPGIGKQLSQKIIRQVFRGHLDDLRKASTIVQGIGENKQQMINRWISKYQRMNPKSFVPPHPEREKIVIEGEKEISKQRKKIEDLKQQKAIIAEKINVLTGAIKELSETKEVDFLQARLSAENATKKVEKYQNGVFSEWEPIPEWFKEAIEINHK